MALARSLTKINIVDIGCDYPGGQGIPVDGAVPHGEFRRAWPGRPPRRPTRQTRNGWRSCDRTPQRLPSTTLEWLELLAAVYGYRPLVLTLRDADNSIVAGTPLLEVRSWLTGQRFISLPFTDYCPPLTRDPASLAGLASALTRWRRNAGEPRVEIRGAMPPSYGFHPVQVGVRHVVALEPDVHRVAARFRNSKIGAIRKAQREGVEVAQIRSPDGLDVFYRLHCMTRRRLGVPVQPRRFFEALWRSIIEREMGFLLLAYRAGQPIAGTLFLSWNRNLIYKYAASDPAHVQFRPNNLLIAAAIEWGCQNGYRTLDFGKTEITNQGLRTFKSGWGALSSR